MEELKITIRKDTTGDEIKTSVEFESESSGKNHPNLSNEQIIYEVVAGVIEFMGIELGRY